MRNETYYTYLQLCRFNAKEIDYTASKLSKMFGYGHATLNNCLKELQENKYISVLSSPGYYSRIIMLKTMVYPKYITLKLPMKIQYILSNIYKLGYDGFSKCVNESQRAKYLTMERNTMTKYLRILQETVSLDETLFETIEATLSLDLGNNLVRADNGHYKYVVSVDCKCRLCGHADDQDFYKYDRTTCKSCITKAGSDTDYQLKNGLEELYFKKRRRVLTDSARKRGLECTITSEELAEIYKQHKGVCFYTGIPFDMTDSRKHKVLSLDRIDSNKGYITGNIVMCLTIINIMKSNLTHEEFLDYVCSIAKRCCDDRIFVL